MNSLPSASCRAVGSSRIEKRGREARADAIASRGRECSSLRDCTSQRSECAEFRGDARPPTDRDRNADAREQLRRHEQPEHAVRDDAPDDSPQRSREHRSENRPHEIEVHCELERADVAPSARFKATARGMSASWSVGRGRLAG